MLQAIRSRAGSVVVKVLFILLILSFGIWGIGDIFRTQTAEAPVAEVGSRSISGEELQRALQAQMQRLRAALGGQIDLQQAKQLGVVDEVLQQLVSRSLIDQEVDRLKLQASDEVVRGAIAANPMFAADGRFDRTMFNQLLAANRLTEDQYVTMMRRDVPRSDLSHALTVGFTAPATLVSALRRYRDETRIAELVAFPASAAGDVGVPADTELDAFYQSHQDLFRVPEYRSFTVASLSADEEAKGIEIPDAKLKQEFEQRQEEFQTPERRDIQQILSSTEEKAKEAQAALAEGKDWNEVATTIAGQDPDAMDLGLLKRSEIPAVLGDVAFSLEPSKVSDPVKSPLGWHLLRVTKVDPATAQSLDEAKPVLKAELAREAAVDQIYKESNRIDDALAGGAKLDQLAKDFHLTLTTISASDVGGRDPAGKPIELPVTVEQAVKLAFSLNERQTSRATETQDGGVFVLRVDTVTAPAVKPLAEVKEQVIAAWQAQKRHEKVVKEAAELAASVTPESPLAKIAGEKGFTLTVTPPLERRPSQQSPVPPALLTKIFGANDGAVITADDGAGAYVAQIKEIKKPDEPPSETADGKISDATGGDALSAQLTQSIQADIAAQYTEALRQRFPVTLHRDAIDRLF